MAENKKALNIEGEIYNCNAIIAQNTINIKENIKSCLGVLSNENIFVLCNANKRPLSPLNCKMIDITNKNDLATLNEALNACKKYKQAKGIGVVLGKTASGVLCGVDIDGCVDKQGNINPEVQKIINLFNSYTEFSPSGKGVHILLYAKKKGKKCNKLKEILDRNNVSMERYKKYKNEFTNNGLVNVLGKSTQEPGEIFYFYKEYYLSPKQLSSNEAWELAIQRFEKLIKLRLNRSKITPPKTMYSWLRQEYTTEQIEKFRNYNFSEFDTEKLFHE